MHSIVDVIAYRPAVKGTRVGFVDLEIRAVGLRINDCTLHRDPTSGATWVQVPASVRETPDGRAIIAPDGRPAFKTVATFPDKRDGRRFTAAVARQIAAKWGAL